jgi:hypothetical protein
MAIGPVLYGTESAQGEWWRTYWDGAAWTYPEAVVSVTGNFNQSIQFSPGDYLYLCRYSNFGCNSNEHVTDEGGVLVEESGNSVYYPLRDRSSSVYIDNTNNFGTNLGAEGGGPLLHGTTLWVWGYRTGKGLTIYKSTDDGATWSEVDAANSPAGPFAGAVASSYDATGEKLYLLFKTTTTGLKWVDFDLSTELWGTQSATFTAGATIGPYISLFRRSNGDLIAMYNRLGSYVYLSVYSGGAWGAETACQTSTDSGNSRPHKAALDSSDTLHFTYTNVNGTPADVNYYRTFNSSNAFNTERAVTELNSLGLTSCYFASATAYGSTVWFTAYGPTNSGNGGVPYFAGPPDGVTSLDFAIPGFSPSGISLGLGEPPAGGAAAASPNVMY